VSDRWAFRGIDPAKLLRLGGDLERRAGLIDETARHGCEILRMQHLVPDAVALGRELGGVVGLLRDESAETRWRSQAIRRAQSTTVAAGIPKVVWESMAEEAEFAATTAFDLHDRTETFAAWREAPAPDELVGMPPGRVFARLSELTPAVAEAYAYRFPELVGSLDGAPVELRYLANRVRIAEHVETLEARLEALLNEQRDLPAPDPAQPSPETVWERLAREDEIRELRDRLADLRLWMDGQILLFDPAGDGRIVEVFGDLESARHVAVVVPGAGSDLDRFWQVRGWARDLAGEAQAVAPGAGIATVAWLGYDPPDGVDAVSASAARAGSGDLARFVEALDLGGTRHVTVIGHSYGSLVAGMAAAGGLDADEVVFVGSPGTGLDDAGDARLRTGGRVWAALARGDPIAYAVDPGDFLSEGFWTEDLWYGTDPASDEFGAIEFATSGASGHSDYFDTGTESLRNLARIVTGRVEEVETSNVTCR